MKVVLIDNRDSFTWNLYQQIAALGAACTVLPAQDLTMKNVRDARPDRIVISPGPHRPLDAKTSLDVIRTFHASVPLLGVCLGHQCLGIVFHGSRAVTHAPTVMHGKTSLVRHTGESLFTGVPNPLRVGRYHSLVLTKVPASFELLAWTGTQQRPETIMAIRHETLPVFGVQFHPESFLTQSGDRLLKNFLRGTW
jgi:anthranilate synthase/aminodeoxychorismate synthase-like glutamine amidotransferase